MVTNLSRTIFSQLLAFKQKQALNNSGADTGFWKGGGGIFIKMCIKLV